MAGEFDVGTDRRSTAAIKWARYAERPRVIPMWIADMEFRAPRPVLDALGRRVEHGVIGYDAPTKELDSAVVSWLASRHSWEIDTDWLVWIPGVMPGVAVSSSIAAAPDDPVMTVTPIYPPFLEVPGRVRRRLVEVPLARPDGRWAFDFEEIEKREAKVFLLCSPHNPTGRVWTRPELERLAAICRDKDALICSDEIWCDLVIDPASRHVPIASLDAETAERTITLMSPSKTFNIAGLYCALAVIPNAGLRRRFRGAIRASFTVPNALGLVAALAAFSEGEPWRRELVAYLRANHARVHEEVEGTAGLAMLPAEATFVAWIDARGAELGDPHGFFEEAGVGLSDGVDFGAPGWVRLNFGCPRSMLDEALGRMRQALLRRRVPRDAHG
ncbi:MAG: MalY/PatB family protein [Planctomycetota bacterium]|jgi:cystathionine beta-lyase